MTKRPFFACLLMCAIAAAPAAASDLEPLKDEAVAVVDAHGTELIGLADQIWAFAETGLRETRSAALLEDFSNPRASRSTGAWPDCPPPSSRPMAKADPIIGILGEYDALPGISQRAQPTQEPLEPGAAGHGCGHNLLGTAGVGAALAIKELIEAGEFQGTVRFYGTPAEETLGGKLYMVRDGLFDDLDAAITWHPDVNVRADTQQNQAMVDFVVEFEGRTAHAAYDPWNGRSAADGAEVFTFALNLMREHVKPTVRMHYVVTDAGDVPNVVPAYATGLVLAARLARRRRQSSARARPAHRRRRGPRHRHHRPAHRASPETGSCCSPRRARSSSTTT